MIITADLHLRKQKPRCRLDEDWIEQQRKSLQEIREIASRCKCPIAIAGDIFHTARQPHEIVNLFISEMKGSTTFIKEGNHDEEHTMENIDKTAYGTIAKIFTELSKEETMQGEQVIFLHELVFKTDKDRPIETIGKTAEELLDEYPDKKWIFVGDNHHNFHFEKNGRHVINPGCINRQKSNMKDYKPGVYHVDIEKGIVEFIELKSDTGELVTDEYIKEQNEREDRIESFVSMIKSQGRITLDFISNLKNKLDSLDKDVRVVVENTIQEVE
jgi:DNA repair exonuclease SbcCD nuclease subunit